ncbi:MAG: radical SAM protein [Myxococcota bacterium]|jgi:uncharacterized protein|nr:radical SAM protein [Myxococcota bacterium]
MLEPSAHNIIGKVHNTSKYFVVNLLSGNADWLSAQEAETLREGRADEAGGFVERGYLVEREDEERRSREAYLDFLDDRDHDEVQVFFVPWYGCNFACDYCYQHPYGSAPELPSEELLDAFFAYLDEQLAGRRKYLTLFGGEPLLPGEGHRRVIRGFVQRAATRQLELAVVSNGYLLEDYLDELTIAKVRELQVTLDGPQAVHDARRPLAGGGGSFERIVAGVDAALKRDLPVNLRVVLDRENLPSLPALARFAVERGWTASPLFKTQLGRNYELHHCHAKRERLFSRFELYAALFELQQRHPEILAFHRPAYSISRFLFDNDSLPPPLFDSCSGCKTEWAFDHSGRIFSCTATVGKDGEELGRFWPSVERDEDAIADWQDRDVLAIEQCRSCALRLACGGGCASLARNRCGELHAPDCRPIRELLELGMAAYGPQEES